MARTAQTGSQQLQLAHDYADAIDAISDRAAAAITAALGEAMSAIVARLRRYYLQFIATDGQELGYSIAENSVRMEELFALAQQFMPERRLKAIEARLQADLQEAVEQGSELGSRLLTLARPGPDAPFGGAHEGAIKAAAQITSAYIRGEVASFRNQLVQIITGGIAKGGGWKSVQKEIQTALMGASDPDGITRRMGLKARAELIARSEIANAYVRAQADSARAQGFEFVRWIATRDELACLVCASRHGKVYPLGEVVAPAHPRCRCVLSPVEADAVTETDETKRRDLLDQDYWEQSQAEMAREMAADRGWALNKVSDELAAALRKPTPSERRQYPDIKRSAPPVA